MFEKLQKIGIIMAILIVVILYFNYNLGSYLVFDYFKNNYQLLVDYYHQNPVLTVISYFLIYIVVTAVSLPGATILTLAAGALFGLSSGMLIVSFASTIGATLAFLISRYFLHSYIQGRFHDKLQTLNRGIEQNGAYYLFMLRLVPLFPFFLINILMGITNIKTHLFFLVSQIGMLAGTLIYINAGVQIAKIDSVAGIISPSLFVSLSLLAIFPLLAKKVVGHKLLPAGLNRGER